MRRIRHVYAFEIALARSRHYNAVRMDDYIALYRFFGDDRLVHAAVNQRLRGSR